MAKESCRLVRFRLNQGAAPPESGPARVETLERARSPADATSIRVIAAVEHAEDGVPGTPTSWTAEAIPVREKKPAERASVLGGKLVSHGSSPGHGEVSGPTGPGPYRKGRSVVETEIQSQFAIV
jgi:hypothetical protein